MKSKVLIKVVAAVVVIGGGVGYFVYQAMQSSWSYYYSVDELAKVDSEGGSHSLRIAGRVKTGSVDRNLETLTLAFVLSGAEAELPVRYKGLVPDNFTEGREVVVEGRLGAGGVFDAKTLMTRCESKYKVKVN